MELEGGKNDPHSSGLGPHERQPETQAPAELAFSVLNGAKSSHEIASE